MASNASESAPLVGGHSPLFAGNEMPVPIISDAAKRSESPGIHDLTEAENGGKEITAFGSFALLINNLTGPAMLGFPDLFHQAGFFPVVTATVFVYISASLCGSFLADSIASIPKNAKFERNIDFSTAFRITVGDNWYVVAETLFVLSCAAQACSALVETAQSLDGFIASFVLGTTYGIQLYPEITFISWSASSCKDDSAMAAGESDVGDCTPFSAAGPLIVSLGYILTTLLFLPLGRGHLKETIFVQLLSFFCLCILLIQFSSEFFERGLHFERIPWIGPDVTQVAGVVLFNYAYSITVPSWLSEKAPEVNVNKTIWVSTTCATLIYLVFGSMGAAAFHDVGGNLLVLLSSSKVQLITRICAALFGVTIIGCGVPIFCVIIRSALLHNTGAGHNWSMFCGAYLPYLISWLLYQGSMLMTVLNWTGLVVNGLVAFILPMVLALKTLQVRAAARKSQEQALTMLSISTINPTAEEGREVGVEMPNLQLITPAKDESSPARPGATYTGGSTSYYAYESLDQNDGRGGGPSVTPSPASATGGNNTSFLSTFFTPNSKAANNYKKVAGQGILNGGSSNDSEDSSMLSQRVNNAYGAVDGSRANVSLMATPGSAVMRSPALDLSNVTLDSSYSTSLSQQRGADHASFGLTPTLRRTLSEIAFERDYAQVTSVNPLCEMMDPLRWHIIVFMLAIFTTVISTTIAIDAITGVTPDGR